MASSFATDTVAAYFRAWDEHDLDAIAATFSDGGTYSDPVAGRGLQGGAITEYARSLFSAFPDLSLELISNIQASNGVVAAPWLLAGTHEGRLMEHAATGKKFSILGCDFITVGGEGIDSVVGFFDPNELLNQLGLG